MSELRDKSPLCPYCGTPLTVQGHTTHYYLCYAWRVAVDPAPPPANLDLYDPEHDPDVVRDD
jgi:hypothetical protein